MVPCLLRNLFLIGYVSISIKLCMVCRIVVDQWLRMPEDVAVDSLTQNLYFTDSGTRIVGVCTVEGKFCSRLIDEDIDQPRGLALYPDEGSPIMIRWSCSTLLGMETLKLWIC